MPARDTQHIAVLIDGRVMSAFRCLVTPGWSGDGMAATQRLEVDLHYSEPSRVVIIRWTGGRLLALLALLAVLAVLAVLALHAEHAGQTKRDESSPK
jgi:hypothetical protein